MSDTVKSWIEERRGAQGRSSGEQWWEESGFINDPDDDRRTLHAVMVNESDYAIAGICYVNRADAEAIVDAHNSLPRALNALNKVLERHQPVDGPWTPDEEFCDECSCAPWSVWVSWPCATVQAIERAINE